MNAQSLERHRGQLERAGLIWKAPVTARLRAVAAWWGVPTRLLTFIGLHTIAKLERELSVDPGNGYYLHLLADYEVVTRGEIERLAMRTRPRKLPMGWV